MLNSILKLVSKGPICPSMEVRERGVREYEMQRGETLEDSIKTSIISSAVDNERIRGNLALNAARLPTYVVVRDELMKISHVQRQLTDLTSQSTA